MHEEGGGGDKVNMISVISLRVSLGVLSLLSVGSSSKPSHYSLTSSLGD